MALSRSCGSLPSAFPRGLRPLRLKSMIAEEWNEQALSCLRLPYI